MSSIETVPTEHATQKSNGAAEIAVTQPAKRRRLRGILLAPLGILPALFWAWLLGPMAGLILAPLFIIGSYWEFSKPIAAPPGSSSPPALATAASASTLAPVRHRRRWWKVPAYGLLTMLGLLYLAIAWSGSQTPPGEGTRGSSASTQAAQDPTDSRLPAPVVVRQETIDDKMGAQNVERVGNKILVTFHTGQLWSEKWIAIRAGETLASLAKWAAQDLAARLPEKQLVLKVHTPTLDQFGKTDSRIVMMLEVNTADFAKIDWSNFSGDMMLNLTTINLAYPAGASALAAYCQDKGREMFARQFCRQAGRFMR